MDMQPGYVLRVIKSLNFILDSYLDWNITYHTHHKKVLEMEGAVSDLFLLIKRTKGKFKGFILLHVDYSLGFGSKDLLQQQDRGSTKFR